MLQIRPRLAGPMPSTPTVAIAFTIAGSAYCGRTGSALVNSIAITWMSLLAIATAWYGRELWAVSMLVIPLVWSAWEWTIDLDVLEALVARDAETHDAVRMAFLMLGVAHATITWRGTRQQNVWIGAAGAIGAGLGTPLNAAVLCWRLNAATPALLPVLNACLPFFVGWLIAYKIGTDSPAESVLVRLEGAEKLVGELEAARYGVLMDRALEGARNSFKFGPLAEPDSLRDVVIDCSEPAPSLPPGPPSSFEPSEPSEPETTPDPAPGTTPLRGSPAHNVSDSHGVMPVGHFFAGQTASGKVLLCEVAVVDGGKHCAWVDLGSDERIVLMEELHASRCDHYFHWNASLPRPRIVGRYGMPVILKANLLTAENKKVVELVAQVEGSEQRLMGLVAESKKMAVQALAAWIRCSDEEAAVPLPPHIVRFLANPNSVSA